MLTKDPLSIPGSNQVGDQFHRCVRITSSSEPILITDGVAAGQQGPVTAVLSPDEHHVAVTLGTGHPENVDWLIDVDRNVRYT